MELAAIEQPTTLQLIRERSNILSQPPKWSDEKTNELIRLWRQGDSASKIAAAIGGVSRNAVLGKAWRLGLDGRKVLNPLQGKGSNGKSRNKLLSPRPVVSRAPKKAKRAVQFRTPEQDRREHVERMERALRRKEEMDKIEVVELTIEQAALAVSFNDLEKHHCRWPFGDPREFTSLKFCGGHKTNGEYCAEHHKLAFEPVR